MNKYFFEDYNPEWVNNFQSVKKMLVEVFGEKALAIEHVGSTSVPGMKAKPIIDVLVVVEKIGSITPEKEKLISLGYQYVDNYIGPNTAVLRKEDDNGHRKENIHVCEKNSPKERQFIVMRDYLRVFPEEACAYASFKESLSIQFPDDYDAYRKAKQPFMKDLEDRAYKWQAQL